MSQEERTVEADVVVVGGGGAGLAAAIEARSLGRDVVLIEKNPKLGGSTAWSIGSITATGTPHQIRRGIRDSPDEHDLAAMQSAREKLDDRLTELQGLERRLRQEQITGKLLEIVIGAYAAL